MLHPNEYIAGIHDVMAAEILAAAAPANPGAGVLVDEVNDLFGRAFVHRRRARRLRRAARRASMKGAHDLSGLVARFAAEQDAMAEENEAVGVSCIRGTHAFGYYSPEEQRLLRRKAFESGLTATQAEQAYSQLTNKLYSAATNYGIDPEGFGSEGEEPDEVGVEDIVAFGVAAECLGGDMPGVFGGAVYDQFGKIFKSSKKRLTRRRARLLKRLKRLTERLEKLEEQGKAGLRVRVLQKRIDGLENRIEKIDGKIAALKKTGEKVEASEEKAEVVKGAEASSRRAATLSDEDSSDLPDDDDALLSEMDDFGGAGKSRRIKRRLKRLMRRLERLEGRERGPLRERRIARLEARIEKLKAALGNEDADLDMDDDYEDDLLEDADDFGLVSEVEVFGLSERKAKRIKRRIARLLRRRARLEERERGPLREKRIAKIDARIAKLKAALGDEDALEADDDLEDSYLTAAAPKAYSQEEWLASFAGSLARHPRIANRQPYVQFFRRRAERRRGSLNIHPNVMGEENRKFFKKIATTVRTKQPVQKVDKFVEGRVDALKAKSVAAARKARRAVAARRGRQSPVAPPRAPRVYVVKPGGHPGVHRGAGVGSLLPLA